MAGAGHAGSCPPPAFNSGRTEAETRASQTQDSPRSPSSVTHPNSPPGFSGSGWGGGRQAERRNTPRATVGRGSTAGPPSAPGVTSCPSCLHRAPLLRGQGSSRTPGAAPGATCERRSWHSSYIGTSWCRSVSAGGHGGWSGRRRPCYSEDRCRASHLAEEGERGSGSLCLVMGAGPAFVGRVYKRTSPGVPGCSPGEHLPLGSSPGHGPRVVGWSPGSGFAQRGVGLSFSLSPCAPQ